MGTDHDYCPICGEKYIRTCKCPLSERDCPNGHRWHRCLVHKKTVIGEPDSRFKTDTMACRCKEGPLLRCADCDHYFMASDGKTKVRDEPPFIELSCPKCNSFALIREVLKYENGRTQDEDP